MLHRHKPLIVAIPSNPITMVDMSMSMFSYGMLEVNRWPDANYRSTAALTMRAI